MCRNTKDEPAFVLLFFNAGKFTNVDIQWFVGALARTLGVGRLVVLSCCGMLSAATRKRDQSTEECSTGCQGNACMRKSMCTVCTRTTHAI